MELADYANRYETLRFERSDGVLVMMVGRCLHRAGEEADGENRDRDKGFHVGLLS